MDSTCACVSTLLRSPRWHTVRSPNSNTKTVFSSFASPFTAEPRQVWMPVTKTPLISYSPGRVKTFGSPFTAAPFACPGASWLIVTKSARSLGTVYPMLLSYGSVTTVTVPSLIRKHDWPNQSISTKIAPFRAGCYRLIIPVQRVVWTRLPPTPNCCPVPPALRQDGLHDE